MRGDIVAEVRPEDFRKKPKKFRALQKLASYPYHGVRLCSAYL